MRYNMITKYHTHAILTRWIVVIRKTENGIIYPNISEELGIVTQ